MWIGGIAVGIAVLWPGPAAHGEAFITPSEVDFGVQPRGVQSAPSVVELVNRGPNWLRVYRAEVNSGPDNADFVPVADGCSGVTLQPGDRCPLEIAFKPTAVGPTTQTLGFDVSGPDYRTFGERAAVVTLRGTGTADGAAPLVLPRPVPGQADQAASPLPVGLLFPIAGVAALGLGFMILASASRAPTPRRG